MMLLISFSFITVTNEMHNFFTLYLAHTIRPSHFINKTETEHTHSRFFSGVTGDWTAYFTPELEEKFENWVEKWKGVAKEIPFKYKINKKA